MKPFPKIHDIYIGKARLLPLLGRIAPAILAAMLKRA